MLAAARIAEKPDLAGVEFGPRALEGVAAFVDGGGAAKDARRIALNAPPGAPDAVVEFGAGA